MAYRFLEFFTAQIRNPHTRRSYVRGVGDFLAWLEAHGVTSIADTASLHVAAYIEELGWEQSAPTVKQHLAAIRRLFDWLASGGIVMIRRRPTETTVKTTPSGPRASRPI